MPLQKNFKQRVRLTGIMFRHVSLYLISVRILLSRPTMPSMKRYQL